MAYSQDITAGIRHDSCLSILAVADLHNHKMELLENAVQTLRPDVVVFAGDGLPSCSSGDTANWLVAIARNTKFGVLAVEGNADGDGALARLNINGVHDLHHEPVDVSGVRFLGLAGASMRASSPGFDLGSPLYSEAQAIAHLDRQSAGHPGPFVLITHAPPHGVLDYSVALEARVGSRAVVSFLNSGRRCPLVICGHVHSSGGRSESFAQTKVWNVASQQREPSRIGLLHLRLTRQGDDVQLSPGSAFGSYLEWTHAGELGFLPEMQWPLAARLVDGGIKTIHELAESRAVDVAACLGWRVEAAAVWPARARAFTTGKPVPLGPLPINPCPRWYIDIETDAHGGKELVWAVALVDHHGNDVEQWHLTSLRGQRGMLRAVAGRLANLPDHSLYAYSGSRFDERLLSWHISAHGIAVPRSVASAMDLRWPLQRAFALPGRATLKDAIQAFGISHRETKLDGLTAALEAINSLRRGRRIRPRLLRYNREDVRVLRDLVRAVEAQVGITSPLPRRSRLSGGAQRQKADERRTASLLAAAGASLEQLAQTSPFIARSIARGQRVTSLVIERELQARQLRLQQR